MASQEDSTPDLQEQVNVLTSRLDEAGVGADAEEEYEPTDDDLFDSLSAYEVDDGEYEEPDEDEGGLQVSPYEEYEEPEPEFQPAYVAYDEAGNPVYLDEQGQPYGTEYEEDEGYDLDEIEGLVDERVADAVQPIRQAMEDARRADELNTFAEAHPDVAQEEMIDQIADRLAPMANQYGEEILTDPRMVAQTYFALKAEAAGASGTPLGEAAQEGAALETGAGAGFGTQSTTDDDIKAGILKAGGVDPVAG
jgi:hypothetical protein